MKSDAELIAAYCIGDANAFEVLYLRYRDPVYNYLLKQVYGHESADDLLQEAFAQVVRKISSYKESQNFKAWLYTIARNLLIDGRRKVSTKREKGIGEQDFGDDKTQQVVDKLEVQDELDRVNQALATMPETIREVLVMRHHSELSFKEIAEIRSCPVGTVLSQVHRGLAMLRDKLGEN